MNDEPVVPVEAHVFAPVAKVSARPGTPPRAMTPDPTRVYVGRTSVCHYLQTYGEGMFTMCGLWHPKGFLGTGSQDEYERAAKLPICLKCAKANGDGR